MQNSKYIIGIDPGTAITGYGIIEVLPSDNFTAIEYGTIRTATNLPLPERLQHIRKDLNTILQRYTFSMAGCEKIFFSKNVKTASSVSEARGVIVLTLKEHGIPFYEYTPPQIKLAITGYGSAKKHQVQYMITQILRLQTTPQPDDAADALAIAITTQRLC